MGEAAAAIMAMSLFGIVGVAFWSITTIWTKRLEAKRGMVPAGEFAQQLARIESAIEVMAVEVERIAEAQRFSARLLAEREGARLELPRSPEVRPITPH